MFLNPVYVAGLRCILLDMVCLLLKKNGLARAVSFARPTLRVQRICCSPFMLLFTQGASLLQGYYVRFRYNYCISLNTSYASMLKRDSTPKMQIHSLSTYHYADGGVVFESTFIFDLE